MVEYGLGRRIHDLKYNFEIGIFLNFIFVFLEFIIHSRASSQTFVKTHQFNAILLYFKQIFNTYLSNITYLHTTSTVF